MAGEKGIIRLVGKRTTLINRLLSVLEKQVRSGQEQLLKMIVTDLVDNLDRDGDKIKNTLRNKRLVQSIDAIFKRYAKSNGLQTVKTIADGVSSLVDFNSQYFTGFAKPAKLLTINSQVKESVAGWLGIGDRGGLTKNGYLDTLLKDPTINRKVKDMTMGAIVGQKGYQETKKQMGDYIAGNKNQTGAMERYYRNFVYDTYSVADRTAAKITADKLQLKYAIYEGGVIKTSREFCRKRNGKVFTREEIAKFNPTVARPPGYNPFTDLGGYGCRHHLNWVPDAVAFALRPDLRNAA